MDQAVAPMTVRDKIDAAQKELDALVPTTSRAAQDVVDLVGGINTSTVSQIDAISSTYLEPLKALNTVVSTIANVLYCIFLEVISRLNLYTGPPLHSDGTGASHRCRPGAPSGWLMHLTSLSGDHQASEPRQLGLQPTFKNSKCLRVPT